MFFMCHKTYKMILLSEFNLFGPIASGKYNEIVLSHGDFIHVALSTWFYSSTEQLCTLSAPGGNTSLKVTGQILYASQAFHQ